MIYLFYLFNLLYEPFYPLYRQIYFTYKSVSEKEHVNKLKQYIKPGMIALDIGANIGFYSLILSQLVSKTGKVYSFEPDKLHFKHLKENLVNAGNVTFFRKAVGDQKNKIKLYHSSSLNTDHQTYDNGEGRKTEYVEQTTIDDILKNEKVDVIKIDVQGYDYFALQGMKKTIKKSKQVLLLGELWPYGLIKAGVKPEDYLKLLKNLGFRVNFFGKGYRNTDQNNKNIYFDFYAIKKT